MDHKELKEAIFDMFRKSKETSNEPQAPKFKTIDSMLGGKMNLTAGDFAQLDHNSDPYKLKAAFVTAYLRGNTDSRASLKTLLDTAPYNEMKDMVDLIDAAKGTANANPNRQFGASNQSTVRRSNSGFPGLSEEQHIYDKNTMTQEQLRMQMLAGIITEGQYKEKMDEAEGMSGKDFALQKIKPYLEKEGYKIGFFNDVSSIPMAKMKDDPTLAALTLDSRGDVTIVLPNDDKGQKILFTSTSNGELIKDLDLENHFSLNKRFYGDGLGLYLIAK